MSHMTLGAVPLDVTRNGRTDRLCFFANMKTRIALDDKVELPAPVSLSSRLIAKFCERFILPPDLLFEPPDIFKKPFTRETQKVKSELGILEI